MAQKKHLEDFLRGRIIGRLECGRTQLEVSEELEITQSVISRLWKRFQDDGNVSNVICNSTVTDECNDDRPHLSGCHSETTCTFVSGRHGAEFLFLDDNARTHRANIVDECLQSEDITRMDWLAYSSDLNRIEHVWDMLGRGIAAHQPPPSCLAELWRALLDEWCNIPKVRLII
ncbi:uncharacterized protein TNCV_2367421 [Trichonephila clavipes]|nr:uncharacterized protein TNCV_2367421 [Trichonephila clavipes]